MTTVHGHNQILQQSGVVQDLSHQIQSPKPDPEQAAVQHQNQQVVENTTIQESVETLSLRQKKRRKNGKVHVKPNVQKNRTPKMTCRRTRMDRAGF